jgi:putative lipoic acid-binding regulatory protein
MEKSWADSFKEKLDQHYQWPAVYIFKFIVPSAKVEEVRELFPLHPITAKLSANGKYTSVTFELSMSSADAVIIVYEKATKIEGLIAL